MDSLTSKYITKTNHKGLSITLSTLGAGVKSLTLNGVPLILEMKDEETYLTSPQLFGKTISRFIGRVKSRGEIDNEPYQLLEETPGICLHGGYLKSMIYQNYDVNEEDNADEEKVIFTKISPDLECGFPGNLAVKVIYTLKKKENCFTIDFEAVSDKNTLLSLSNHMYWNLNPAKNIDDHLLEIKASSYGAFEDENQLIVRKEEVPSYLDFRSLTRLGTKLDEIEKRKPVIDNLDHTFVFDEVTENRPQVILENDRYKVDFYTDFDAVNVYVDSTLSDVEFINDVKLTMMKRRAIAIEPQQFVLGNIYLKACEKYHHQIRYDIKKKESEEL